MRVKKGDRVKRGQPLGRCGNSGQSTEPHLHFQLQDGPRIESAWGVEPVFDRVALIRNGKQSTTVQYRFLKGDLVEP
jgi:murein DD-endopeptidase MepM/ murein hydrolase activator NlpD